MPIRSFVPGKAFNPDTIEIMNTVFLGVCTDLGLADKSDGAREIVAKRVIELMDGQLEPEAIRKIMRASMKTKAE